MTNISMYNNLGVYTEKVDEFVILRYTIAGGHANEATYDRKRKETKIKGGIKIWHY